MKKSFKKVLASLLAAVMVLTCTPLNGFTGLKLNFSRLGFSSKAGAVNSLAPSGQCGDNAFWSFDESTGLLTISGTGDAYENVFEISPFFNNASIRSVVIENGITSVGNHAFEYCTGLESVTLPDSVTVIKSGTFAGCTGLTDITVPDGVTEIRSSAFYGCTALTGITVPDSVTGIEGSAFEGCSSLADLTLGNRLAYIGERAFSGCISLTEVTVPDSVTHIQSYAFSGCTSLTDAVIGNCVYQIDESAFENCTGLTGIIIPDCVMTLGSSAFSGCTGLTEATVGNNAAGLYENVFSGCTALEKVTIGRCVESIDATAFSGCRSLTKVNVTDLGAWCGITFGSANENPLYYAHNLYLNDVLVTDLVIPDGVTRIGPFAFYGCTCVSGLTVADSVTDIGTYAFYGCTGLENLTLGNGVTSVGSRAFSGCRNLTGAAVPDSVTDIGSYAFFNCTALKSLTLGSRLTTIGEMAFSGCKGLTDVTIPDNVTNIARGTFSGCSTLKSVSLPDGVTGIGMGAFENCFVLSDLTIPQSVTSIGPYAFSCCNGLTGVTIPDGVTSIGSGAFYHVCHVAYSPAMTAEGSPWGARFVNRFVDGCLIYENSSMQTLCCCSTSASGCITLPDSVTSVAPFAFDECTGVTSVTIPDSVTSIGSNAFFLVNNVAYSPEMTVPGSPWGAKCANGYVIGPLVYENSSRQKLCGCSSAVTGGITVPESVTAIGNGVFAYCSGLTGLTIPQSVTSIGSSTFEGCDNLTVNCYADSFAQSYAISNRIPYTIIGSDGDSVYAVHILSEKLILSPGVSVTLNASVEPGTAANKNLVWYSSNTSAAEVSGGRVTPVKPGKTVITAQTEDGGYMDFCTVRITGISPAVNTRTVINHENSLIYGLSVRTENIEDYVAAASGITLSCSTATVGTGTKVNLICDGETVDTYETVIFGDVNGDGIYDGTDAMIVSCIANGMLTRAQAGEAVWTAADCNHDGAIDSLDVSILEQAGVLLAGVDQSKSDAELQTDSVYLEYLSLINQNPGTEEPAGDTDHGNVRALLELIFEAVVRLLRYVLKLFTVR